MEGTEPVPPDRPCAERDDDVLPVLRVIPHFFEVSTKRWGCRFYEHSDFFSFMVNSVEFRLDTTLFPSCSSGMRRAAADGGFLCGGSVTNNLKKLPSTLPLKRPEAGIHHTYECIR